MLDLHYGPDVPASLVDMIEHHAKAAGLALADVELVGRDLATAEAFIVAAESGAATAFAFALTKPAPVALAPAANA